MPKSLLNSLCEIQDVKLAYELFLFLDDYDPGALYDDEDMLEQLREWNCQSVTELANYLNEMMVASIKAYFESCLVKFEHQETIKSMFSYTEHYDENSASLSFFQISFLNAKFRNPTKMQLENLSEFVKNYEAVLDIGVYPHIFWTLSVSCDCINELCGLDDSIIKIPYNPLNTEAYLINMIGNKNYHCLLQKLAKVNREWIREIYMRNPKFILLIDESKV